MRKTNLLHPNAALQEFRLRRYVVTRVLCERQRGLQGPGA